MKSYLRFLSRNKLYTAIEVVGLSVALAFVLLLGNVVLEDLSCDKKIRNAEDIYLVLPDDSGFYRPDPEVVFPQVPEIEDWCNAVIHTAYDGKTQYIQTVSREQKMDITPVLIRGNYFKFFGIELKYGDPKAVMELQNAAVISEEVANAMFPGQNPVGQTLIINEHRLKDVQLTVTGVYKNMGKTVLQDRGMFLNMGYIKNLDNEMYQPHIRAHLGRTQSIHYVKLSKGADAEKIGKFLFENNDTDPDKEYARYTKIDLIPFSRIHHTSELSGNHFDNVTNVNMYHTFMFACLILLVFAGLNYISLTMAFSRFRVKEMATRQLLGTTKGGIYVKCISEAATLVTASFAVALALAFALKNIVGELLGSHIVLFNTSGMWIFAIGVVVILSLAAGLVPALVMSRYKPIEVIKGEARKSDKVTLGKIFIGLEGLLSIAAIAVTLTIYAQTRHMIDTPMGYETEKIIFVDFVTKDNLKFKDELLAESYVDRIGDLTHPPTSFGMMTYLSKGHTMYVLSGNSEAMDILGIKVLEDFGTSSTMKNGSTRKSLLCKSSYERLKEHIDEGKIKLDVTWAADGVVSDFKQMSIKEYDPQSVQAVLIQSDTESYLYGLLVKVNGDENEALKKIREFYRQRKDAENMPKIDTLNSLVEERFEDEQKVFAMIGVFALLSILITIMAIIALSSYSAQMSTHDTAVRKVFGCSNAEIYWQMVKGFLIPVLAGSVIAIAFAYAYIERWLSEYPVRIENTVWIYAVSVIIVIAVVVISISFQAYHLMRTNPSEALKKE
ncbi:MAG: ABC transporter permease [Bacteroidales bacterium]|nr:ABC transporter permease [Bacteroidales bacterium]